MGAGTIGHEPKAAGIVLRALERLDKLLRLEKGEASASQETLVISADPEEYARQLREVAEDRDHERGGRAQR